MYYLIYLQIYVTLFSTALRMEGGVVDEMLYN